MKENIFKIFFYAFPEVTSRLLKLIKRQTKAVLHQEKTNYNPVDFCVCFVSWLLQLLIKSQLPVVHSYFILEFFRLALL